MSCTNPFDGRKLYTKSEILVIIDWLEDRNMCPCGIDVYLKDGDTIHYTYSTYSTDRNKVVDETEDMFHTRSFKEIYAFISDYSQYKPFFPYESMGISFESKMSDLIPLFYLVM